MHDNFKKYIASMELKKVAQFTGHLLEDATVRPTVENLELCKIAFEEVIGRIEMRMGMSDQKRSAAL